MTMGLNTHVTSLIKLSVNFALLWHTGQSKKVICHAQNQNTAYMDDVLNLVGG